MNKIILIIIVILIAVAGGYFLLRGGYQAPAPVTPEVTVPEETSEVTTPEEEVSAPIPSEAKEFAVSGNEYSFNPSSINVKAGDQVKITLKNTGRLVHNFVIRDLGVSGRTISPGQTDTIEFAVPEAGTYTFICSVPGHAIAGMLGDLVVE